MLCKLQQSKSGCGVAGHDVSASLLLSSSEKENELEKGAEHDQSIQRMHAGDSDH